MTIKHYLQNTRLCLRILNGINIFGCLLGFPVLLLLMLYANTVITMVCLAMGFTQIALIVQSWSFSKKIIEWEPFEAKLMWIVWSINSFCAVILWGYIIKDIGETAYDPQRALSFTGGAVMFHGLCQLALMSTIRRLRVCERVLEAHTARAENRISAGETAIV